MKVKVVKIFLDLAENVERTIHKRSKRNDNVSKREILCRPIFPFRMKIILFQIILNS